MNEALQDALSLAIKFLHNAEEMLSAPLQTSFDESNDLIKDHYSQLAMKSGGKRPQSLHTLIAQKQLDFPKLIEDIEQKIKDPSIKEHAVETATRLINKTATHEVIHKVMGYLEEISNHRSITIKDTVSDFFAPLEQLKNLFVNSRHLDDSDRILLQKYCLLFIAVSTKAIMMKWKAAYSRGNFLDMDHAFFYQYKNVVSHLNSYKAHLLALHPIVLDDSAIDHNINKRIDKPEAYKNFSSVDFIFGALPDIDNLSTGELNEYAAKLLNLFDYANARLQSWSTLPALENKQKTTPKTKPQKQSFTYPWTIESRGAITHDNREPDDLLVYRNMNPEGDDGVDLKTKPIPSETRATIKEVGKAVSNLMNYLDSLMNLRNEFLAEFKLFEKYNHNGPRLDRLRYDNVSVGELPRHVRKKTIAIDRSDMTVATFLDEPESITFRFQQRTVNMIAAFTRFSNVLREYSNNALPASPAPRLNLKKAEDSTQLQLSKIANNMMQLFDAMDWPIISPTLSEPMPDRPKKLVTTLAQHRQQERLAYTPSMFRQEGVGKSRERTVYISLLPIFKKPAFPETIGIIAAKKNPLATSCSVLETLQNLAEQMSNILNRVEPDCCSAYSSGKHRAPSLKARSKRHSSKTNLRASSPETDDDNSSDFESSKEASFSSFSFSSSSSSNAKSTSSSSYSSNSSYSYNYSSDSSLSSPTETKLETDSVSTAPNSARLNADQMNPLLLATHKTLNISDSNADDKKSQLDNHLSQITPDKIRSAKPKELAELVRKYTSLAWSLDSALHDPIGSFSKVLGPVTIQYNDEGMLYNRETLEETWLKKPGVHTDPLTNLPIISCTLRRDMLAETAAEQLGWPVQVPAKQEYKAPQSLDGEVIENLRKCKDKRNKSWTMERFSAEITRRSGKSINYKLLQQAGTDDATIIKTILDIFIENYPLEKVKTYLTNVTWIAESQVDTSSVANKKLATKANSDSTPAIKKTFITETRKRKSDSSSESESTSEFETSFINTKHTGSINTNSKPAPKKDFLSQTHQRKPNPGRATLPDLQRSPRSDDTSRQKELFSLKNQTRDESVMISETSQSSSASSSSTPNRDFLSHTQQRRSKPGYATLPDLEPPRVKKSQKQEAFTPTHHAPFMATVIPSHSSTSKQKSAFSVVTQHVPFMATATPSHSSTSKQNSTFSAVTHQTKRPFKATHSSLEMLPTTQHAIARNEFTASTSSSHSNSFTSYSSSSSSTPSPVDRRKSIPSSMSEQASLGLSNTDSNLYDATRAIRLYAYENLLRCKQNNPSACIITNDQLELMKCTASMTHEALFLTQSQLLRINQLCTSNINSYDRLDELYGLLGYPKSHRIYSSSMPDPVDDFFVSDPVTNQSYSSLSRSTFAWSDETPDNQELTNAAPTFLSSTSAPHFPSQRPVHHAIANSLLNQIPLSQPRYVSNNTSSLTNTTTSRLMESFSLQSAINPSSMPQSSQQPRRAVEPKPTTGRTHSVPGSQLFQMTTPLADRINDASSHDRMIRPDQSAYVSLPRESSQSTQPNQSAWEDELNPHSSSSSATFFSIGKLPSMDSSLNQTRNRSLDPFDDAEFCDANVNLEPQDDDFFGLRN